MFEIEIDCLNQPQPLNDFLIFRTKKKKTTFDFLINVANLSFLSKLLFDPAPIVRSMAVWALGQIGDKKTIKASYKLLFFKEQDEVVQSEWARVVERLHP